MTKIERPECITDTAWAEFEESPAGAAMTGLHGCIDENHAEMKKTVSRFSRLTLGNIVAVAGLGLALTSGVITILTTMSNGAAASAKRDELIDMKLDGLTAVVADQKVQDGHIEQMMTDVAVLKATSQENNTALLGPNSASNQRHRATGQ